MLYKQILALAGYDIAGIASGRRHSLAFKSGSRPRMVYTWGSGPRYLLHNNNNITKNINNKKRKERMALRRQSRTAAALTAYGFEVRTPNPRGSSQQFYPFFILFLFWGSFPSSVIVGYTFPFFSSLAFQF